MAVPDDTRSPPSPDGPEAMPGRPFVTRAGLIAGARLTLPLWPGLAVFACAAGAAAAQKGLSFAEAVAMSGLVFAGAGQMVALEVWRPPLDLATFAAIVTVTLFVNGRMALMGATIQPWLKGLPFASKAFHLFFLTDANWLIATRDRAEGGRDLGILFGGGLALWPMWVLFTGIGHAAGALVAQPKAFGLDFIVPALFVATLVPLWRGVRPALPWFASGAVALVVQALVPGYAFIVAGALAGVAVGVLVDDGATA